MYNQGATPEVFYARNKLDGVLQHLVDKKDDSSEAEDQFSEHHEYITHPATTQMTPTKRAAASFNKGRKRRRIKDELEPLEIGLYHHTYVMKLFDRSVDLAQFEQQTPLYPICRAWMQNEPHNRNLATQQRTPTPPPDTDESNFVYQLPQPIKKCEESRSESSNNRIPEAVPQPNEKLNINADPNYASPPEQLLLNHMARWKVIRHKWKLASQHAESQYAPSMHLLRDMFETQCKEQQ